MYQAVILAIIFLAATSTGTVAFFKLPELSYGDLAGAPEPPTLAPRTGIYFTGDLMLARRVETILDRNGSDYVYRGLPPIATTTDWVVTNFEAAAPRRHIHTPDLTFRFSVEERHLASLAAFGVTHASLANNHSYDTGHDGFEETYDALRRVGIVPFGDQRVGTSSVAVLPISGATVAVVALYAVDTTPDVEAVERLLQSVAHTNYQIAYIHWGSEYTPVHLGSTEVLARTLVSLGFDAIVGHHPHVVQDIGLIDAVPVFYSLGNFVFDQYFSREVQEGLILRLTIVDGKLSFALMPHTSTMSRSQPRLMEGEAKIAFLRELGARSTPQLRDQIMASSLTISRDEVANLR